MLDWEFLHPRMSDYYLGEVGKRMTEQSPRSAREQIKGLYPFGGWQVFPDMEHVEHLGGNVLKYPGDPPMLPIARAKLRDEVICIYEAEFWAVFQPDGTFEMSRLD